MQAAQATRDALEKPSTTSTETSPTLVYWKDETGEHSFVTAKKVISD